MCVEKIDLNGYELSRNWFDFCFENPEKITPSHTALYFFIIEHCNRLGWKEKFGLPTQMAMDAIGVKNWRTYSKSFNDLVSFGFINVIESSKNQYSATVIALVKNTKANTKALTKAIQKHVQKQSNSIAVIDKPFNQEPLTIEQCGDNFQNDPALVPDMQKIWVKKFPKYFLEKNKDFPALLKISSNVAQLVGVTDNPLSQTGEEKNQIKHRWGEIVDFISREDFFKNYSLSQVDRHFQSILQKEKNGNSKTSSANHGKSSGAYELAEQLREELGFN